MHAHAGAFSRETEWCTLQQPATGSSLSFLPSMSMGWFGSKPSGQPRHARAQRPRHSQRLLANAPALAFNGQTDVDGLRQQGGGRAVGE